jgi:uncharacterized protein (TIGR03437 family)
VLRRSSFHRSLLRLAGSAAWFLFPAIILAQPSAYTITTIVGNGTAGATGDNGAATSAELDGPIGLALDASHNIYLSDSANNKIRKVTGTTIAVFAGSSSSTYDLAGYGGDGGSATGSTVQFNSPYGVRVDSNGNVYIADLLNHVIREVSGGKISTICGNDIYGFSGDGGPASSAQLNQPFGLAIDSNNNLYVSDSQNNRVRKISNGIITTVAGNGFSNLGDGGPALSAGLNDPYGIAVDAAGNLYIADSNNHRIRKVDTNGIITTVAGTGTKGVSGDGGLAINAELNRPWDVAVDSSGDLFIADYGNSRIREVFPNGTIQTIAGGTGFGYTGDGFIATNAKLDFPTGVTVDNSTGKIYVVDSSNNVIRLLTPYAPTVSSVQSAGQFGAFPAIAPGSWIEIYGSNLSFDAREWGTSDFSGNAAPTALDGTKVTIGGQSAFVYYISGGQVNVQVPSNVSTGQQQLIVQTPAGSSAAYNVTVNATEPGLLTFSGTQYLVALDGQSYVLPPGTVAGVNSIRAKAGDTISLYGIGFGNVNPSIPAGQIVQTTNTLALPLQISIGGTTATVSYQGLEPPYVGLYQFNVVVPAVASSDKVPVTFTLNGTAGTQTLYIAVQ